MKLKIIRTIRMAGAPMVQILAGSSVDVPMDTARKWIESGAARLADDKAVAPAEMPAGNGLETTALAAAGTQASTAAAKAPPAARRKR